MILTFDHLKMQDLHQRDLMRLCSSIVVFNSEEAYQTIKAVEFRYEIIPGNNQQSRVIVYLQCWRLGATETKFEWLYWVFDRANDFSYDDHGKFYSWLPMPLQGNPEVREVYKLDNLNFQTTHYKSIELFPNGEAKMFVHQNMVKTNKPYEIIVIEDETKTMLSVNNVSREDAERIVNAHDVKKIKDIIFTYDNWEEKAI